MHNKYTKKNLCLGPLGFPMRDQAARELEIKLRKMETQGLSYKRNFVTAKPLELNEGERADISVITTADVDRDHEVILTTGINLEEYQSNPVVTWGHDYSLPPVGRSLWMKFEPTKAKATSIKAKTEYAPEGLYDLADTTWNLVKAGFLLGKSVGMLPEEVSPPTQKEIDVSEGRWSSVKWVIRKATLYEYAVATVPANQNALVEAVAKGSLILPECMQKSLGLSVYEVVDNDLWDWGEPEEEIPIPKYSKSWKEIEAEMVRRLR